MVRRKPKSKKNYDSTNKNFSKKRREGRTGRGLSAEPDFCDDCEMQLCDEHRQYNKDCEFCTAHDNCS